MFVLNKKQRLKVPKTMLIRNDCEEHNRKINDRIWEITKSIANMIEPKDYDGKTGAIFNIDDINQQNLTELRILHILQNDIHEIDFKDLIPKSVHTLIMNNLNLKSIKNIPSWIQRIDLNNNQLTELPELPCLDLKYLLVRNNKLKTIEEVPETLLQLDCGCNREMTSINIPQKLEKLVCEYTALKTLPKVPKNCRVIS